MAFRRTCNELIDRFGGTNNPDRAQWIARTCVLALRAPDERVSGLVRAAERWREVEPGGVHQLSTLGAALVRAGRVDAADTLRAALRAAGAKGDSWASSFLQIAEAAQTGRKLPCMPAAPASVNERPGAGNANVTWRQRVELEALARELCPSTP